MHLFIDQIFFKKLTRQCKFDEVKSNNCTALSSQNHFHSPGPSSSPAWGNFRARPSPGQEVRFEGNSDSSRSHSLCKSDEDNDDIDEFVSCENGDLFVIS
uniref:Uncharacterized protein n=1 Tax=Romanomermis culicivorax TaxID=13658 RepID=A0A915HWJ1_ROMCU